MGRPRKQRRPRHRPNFLDAFILYHFVLRGVPSCEPRGFPRTWVNGTPGNGLPDKVAFSRRAVYYGFERLSEKGLLRRVSGRTIRYELADRGKASAALAQFWENLVPLHPAPPRVDRHARLKHSLRGAGRSFERLPRPLKREYADAIAETHIIAVPAKGTVSLHTQFREMLTLEDAQELESKVQNLLSQYRFTCDEKRTKEVPLKSRPAGWRRPGWKAPRLSTQEVDKHGFDPHKSPPAIAPQEHPECPECGIKTLFDPEKRVFVCPNCGLEFNPEVYPPEST